MEEERASRLFELADLILAVGRHIHASKEVAHESWTPLESAVMRWVDRNPGTTASAAADSTRLISSNFSRAVRSLETKGRLRRDVDPRDGRRVRLYPTDQADEHLAHLRDAWSHLLDGTVAGSELADLNASLRRIENELVSRSRRVAGIEKSGAR